MTKSGSCPCNLDGHRWEVDDYCKRTGNCYWCDCHIWCFACADTRPPVGLVHQCHADPEEWEGLE